MNGNEVALRADHSRYVLKMLADPDLTGDTLLFAIAAMGVYFERQLADRRARLKRSYTHSRVIEATGWRGTAHGEAWRAIKADLPRYEPPDARATNGIACSGQMIRREGLCGKPTWTTAALRDPDTGAYELVGGCTRHWPEVQARVASSVKAWRASGSPKPPNNRGGALLKYFNTEYVEALYRWVGGDRYDAATPPPPPATPRPNLTVIHGGRNF